MCFYIIADIFYLKRNLGIVENIEVIQLCYQNVQRVSLSANRAL